MRSCARKRLAIGNGAEYTNVFPLMHTTGVQEHWKAASDQKRVFLLTRSAFLGQQRVGATVWSGDVYSTWWGLRHQVAAGLNFALSGYPYWTTDIGGYWPAYNGKTQIADYQELYARWWEFGVFCPIFRTHGHRPQNEIWSYPQVEPVLIEYDKLRYRLMPYIYSLAWKVTSDDYTIQRPLVMDWRTDARTWNIGDQFMFGPALMVAPVLEAGATSRRVYLPETAGWYDFWTGDRVQGGREVEAAAPLDRIPLYVRAGSIVPMGPEIEYANQNPGGPIELRIYRGADGQFDLIRGLGRQLRVREGAARGNSSALERSGGRADDWGAAGLVSGNGGGAAIPDCAGGETTRRGRSRVGAGRRAGDVQREGNEGEGGKAGESASQRVSESALNRQRRHPTSAKGGQMWGT